MATEGDLQEFSLPALFERAFATHSRSDEFSSSSAEDVEEMERACKLLVECSQRVAALSLFSSNEDLDDVGTPALKYILVPWMLAELAVRLPRGDRLAVLSESQALLSAFAAQCERLGMRPQGERQVAANEGPLDPARRRTEKIARFRRQKELERQIAGLSERRTLRLRGRALEAALADDDAAAAVEEHLDDEPEERQGWLLRIELALGRALDLHDSLQREESMLLAPAPLRGPGGRGGGDELAARQLDDRAAQAEERHRQAAQRARAARPGGGAPPITCATFARDVIEGRAQVGNGHEHKHEAMVFGPMSLIGSSLTTERERAAARVFQPTHSLPRMSIEQAGAREMEIMGVINKRTAEAAAEAEAAQAESGGDMEDEEELERKTRAWDDWKDDHPRGMGNSKLTPCG